jgi:hypothetical protein
MKSVARRPAARRLLSRRETHCEWLAALDWWTLGWRLTSPPYPLVYLGTPGPKRKAVVHLIDRDSKRCELIVKVPLTEAAKDAIKHDAQALLELQTARFAGAPRLVAFDSKSAISSQTVVPGKRCGLKFTREVVDLLPSLLLPGQSITLREIALQLASCTADFNFGDLALVSAAFDQLDDTTELPATRIHGDFAPWNIKLHDGSAVLVDWEEYQPCGLPLHDAYHFVHMTRYLFGKAPRSCWQGLRFHYAEPLTAVLRWKLELAYLLQRLFLEPALNDQKHKNFLMTTLRLTLGERP